MFTFLFVDMFDTVGTLIGCATKADMIKPDGTIPNVKEALFADSVGTTVGAVLGTSTVTTFVESSAGVVEGGRTGLTALVVAAFSSSPSSWSRSSDRSPVQRLHRP